MILQEIFHFKQTCINQILLIWHLDKVNKIRDSGQLQKLLKKKILKDKTTIIINKSIITEDKTQTTQENHKNLKIFQINNQSEEKDLFNLVLIPK